MLMNETPTFIRLFIKNRTEQLELSLPLEQVERFQEKASGLFIWCITILRYIEVSMESKSGLVTGILKPWSSKSMDNPHAPLYLLYHQVLESTTSAAGEGKIPESVLSVIFVAATRRHPIPERTKRRKEGVDWDYHRIPLLILYIEKGANAVRAYNLFVLDFIGGLMIGGFAMLMTDWSEYAVPRLAGRMKESHTCVFDGCLAIIH